MSHSTFYFFVCTYMHHNTQVEFRGQHLEICYLLCHEPQGSAGGHGAWQQVAFLAEPSQ